MQYNELFLDETIPRLVNDAAPQSTPPKVPCATQHHPAHPAPPESAMHSKQKPHSISLDFEFSHP